MATSAAPQAITKSVEMERALAARASSTRTAAVVKEDPFATIKANPVFQVMQSSEIAPQDKPKAFAAIFAKVQTEAEARETMKAFEQLKEFYATQREELAVAMIRVQQSETQVELQRSLKDLNQGMLDVETQLKPVTDVLDAIFKLSLTDKAYDAFKEIKRDQALVADAKKVRDDIEAKVNNAAARLKSIEDEEFTLKNDKNWIGQIRGASQKKLDDNAREAAQIQIDLSRFRTELEAATAKVPESTLDPELQSSKEIIAKFLDLGDGEVQAQQEALFKSGLDFIQANKDRVGNMRRLLQNDSKSIIKMVDASETLGIIYATMSDGCGLTSEALKERRAELLPKEGEVLGATEKMLRAKKLKDLDSFIEVFTKEKGNTLQAVGKVTALQEKLDNVKRSNEDGLELTRIMHTDAIAEVSEGLVTTFTSLSTAAIGQSANVAKQNMKRMNDLTNTIAQKDSIRSAMGEEDRVREVNDTIDSVRSWTDTIVARKDILTGTFGRFKDKVAELQESTQVAKAARDEAASVAAKIATEDDVSVAVSKETGSLLNLGIDAK